MMMEQSNNTKSISEVINHLSERDSTLAKIVQTVDMPVVKNMADGFSILVKTIVSQQLSGKAANAIFKRFMEFHGLSAGFQAEETLLATTRSIRHCGISNSKAKFIQELREKVIQCPYFFHSLVHLNDEELETNLLKIKGVGVWTANILMISFYGRIDIFPKNDATLNNVLHKVYGLGEDHAKYSSIIDHWRPYRSIAAQILWNAQDNRLV